MTRQTKRRIKEVAKLQTDAIHTLIEITENQIPSAGNILLSGNAVWISGLTYQVSQCSYIIGGELFESLTQEVTLADAHATLPRIDVIAVDINGVAVAVSGTAASDPVKPEANPATQVEVTFATVAALATEPEGVSNTVVYDEDDNWTTTESAATVLSDNTADPYAGTKHISFIDTASLDYMTLDDGSATNFPADFSNLKFYIKNNNAAQMYNKKVFLQFALFNGTTRVSGWVSLKNGFYGYDHGNSGYQLVGIPVTDFDAEGVAFDILKIQAVGSIDAYLDNITLEAGGPVIDLTGYAELDKINRFTKAQATQIITLTDAATITIDLSQANMFEVVLDGNRTIDFTNATPGQHFTLLLVQDDTTGSRLITWDAANDWAGGTAPTLSTGVDDVDVLTFAVDSSGNIHGSLGIADSS
jgi:hypothetical protein